MPQDTSIYSIGAAITGFVVFVASWIYCIAEYGYLLGVGLGWLPSLIVAGLAAIVWPLVFLVVVVVVFLVLKQMGIV